MASVWSELKRRNVVRVAIAYAVVAWLMIEIASTLFPVLRLPEWTTTFVTVLLFIGFPVALVFAWAYEVTPEGLKKEKDVDRSKSITHLTGRKLDFVIIGVLGAAVIYFVSEKLFWSETVVEPRSEASVSTTEQVTRSIAVLPFVNMSGDADQEYFSDGITEEILNALAGIEELSVTSRTSAFAFKGKSMSIPKIAKELGVAHILEGSVRRSGDQLRITAQLIEVESDRHLWSETYNRELTDIFAVQDEISADIATALKISLLGATTVRPSARAADPAAYDLYLHGLQELANHTFASLVEAEKYFQQAIAVDPMFVRALAALGWTYANQVWSGSASLDDNRPKIREVLRRGLELDPDNGALVGLSGDMAYWDGDQEQALLLYRRATTLDPPLFGVWFTYSRTLMNLGYLEEAKQILTEWRETDPLNPLAIIHHAFVHQFTGNFETVFAAVSHLKSSAPNNPYGSFIDGLTRIVYLGDLANGIIELEAGLDIDPNDHEAASILAIACYSIVDLPAGDAWVERGQQIAPKANFVKAAEAYALAIRGDVEFAREISLAVLVDHRQFHRWWGGFLTMRLAIDKLIDRGEAARAVQMILEADPAWDTFRNQSSEEAPHLSSNPGLYHSTAWMMDYMADFARALRAAGDEAGADNVLAHMDALQNWQREHGVIVSETGVAELHALRGMNDDALDALERAEKDRMIYIYWQHRLINNRIFDDIRDHRRFVALVERVQAEMQRQRDEYRRIRPPRAQIPL